LQDIISKAKILFDNAGFEWSICGGGAIDMYIGQETRTHKDLDIAVYWEDRNTIITFMLNAGWRVFEACGGGEIHELFTNISLMKRNLFCFTSRETRCHLELIEDNKYRFTFANQEQNDFNYVEFLFNLRDNDYFYYSGNSNIKRSVDKSITIRNGFSLLSPEIVLLYKSTYLDGNDSKNHHHDFNLSLSYLDYEQRLWLKKALEVVHLNNHQWLLRL
jgi:hypothetical protein